MEEKDKLLKEEIARGQGLKIQIERLQNAKEDGSTNQRKVENLNTKLKEAEHGQQLAKSKLDGLERKVQLLLRKEEQFQNTIDRLEGRNASLGRKLCDQFTNLLYLNGDAPKLDKRQEADKFAGLRAKADFNIKRAIPRKSDPNDSDDVYAISRPRRRSIDTLLYPSPQDSRDFFDKEYIQPSGILRQQVSTSLRTQDKL